ncbi:Cell surface glycoprotein 1 [Rhizoctonia solani]|uniref:Cell surface glycoprotein 1 n=1 Tax=Rhizoctonia solani TaxID=456999 RepID=A0A0K6G9B4_9AGAM|nr:Cell surface glycoprotein 1 [Rhizoctonia solani]
MVASSCEGVNSASAASSRFPSICSSITSEHESETIHSTFARKSHGDTGVVPTPADNSIGSSISTGEQQSSDIFSLSDQQLSDKLKFVKEVGFGNWGSVWLCEPRFAEEQVAFGSQIAVKLVHRSKTPTTAARVRSLWNEMKIVRALRREATASSSSQEVVGVGHPNVIQFHSFIITPSYALITMQYLPIPVPVEVPEFRAKPWFHALTDAVAFLHQRGVVHNDIKPANIILTGGSSPMPVLVDFGFAEHYTLTSRHAFQSNLAYGTPEYLAPERAKGQPHDTRKSDVYALGITFFEILVGRTPFEEVEGESFVSKEDLERYWTRTVKGKWVGKWEGIMSKPCEKALKRMTLPNADLRATAVDILADPYFKGEDDLNRSNLSVDLSILSDIIPPWSRQSLASRSKSRAQASIKSKQTTIAKRPPPVKAATTKAMPTADKENVQPVRSETVKSRTGTLHRTSKSITEAFRKSVGTSKKAPRKTAVEVFEIVTPGNVASENAPVIKPKESHSVLKRKNSAAVLKDKNPPKVLKEQASTNVLREKSLKPKDSTNVLKEKKSAVGLKEKRSAFTLAPKKKEPVQDKENVKPKGHSRAFPMNLSFTRSFGRKQAKEKEGEEALGQPMDKRPSMYFSCEPESPVTPTDSPAPIKPTNTTARDSKQASHNPRDVRSVFNIIVDGSTPTNASDSSKSTTTDASSRITNSSTTSRSIVFSLEPKTSTAPEGTTTPVDSGSVRNRQSLFDRTHKLETPERTPVTPRSNAASKSFAKHSPRLPTVAQSPASITASPSSATNKARVSKITAKENRRTNVVARTSPAKPRGTPVKAKPSPGRVRASPAKVATSPARPRNSKAPVFTIGPKANTGSKVPPKKAPTKVLGDATNTTGSVRVKPGPNTKKPAKKTEEGHEDEGDDTITLPVEVIRSSALSRMSKSSSTSIIKQSILHSIDKVRFGRSSVSATEIIQSATSEPTGRRRSLSVDEAFSYQHDQSVSENQESQMANWIRGVEKVVEDARQSFQAGDSTPLALPPPPPRLNHSQSAGLTRISTSAKNPTILTIVSNVNPSVTTFAAAPQAPARNRRATVGSTTPTPPSTASSPTFNTLSSQSGHVSRPITPCLNAELGKEPVVTSPRLCDVIDADSRKLILGQVGMSVSASHSRSTSYESNAGRITLSSDAQRARFFQTPSPSHSRTHSRMTSTNSTLSRPATAMSGKISNQDAEVETTEQVYDKFLKTQETVIRKGKGYQSDYTIRGKGIEHIASDSESDAKQGFFTRVASPTNLVPERAFRAFKTMMSGGGKKRVPIHSANTVFVGGGFGPGSDSSRTKALPSYPRSWSRAQAT